jgi:hypothetical protein
VIDEIIADDVLVHGMSLVGDVKNGKAAIKRLILELKTAFPGLLSLSLSLSLTLSLSQHAHTTHSHSLSFNN